MHAPGARDHKALPILHTPVHHSSKSFPTPPSPAFRKPDILRLPQTERTFYVDDNEVKMKDQARFDVFLKLSGTNGLIDTTVTREHPLILTMLDTIVEGGRYTCSSIGKGSVLAELKDSVKNHQGFVDKMANNFERAVSAAHPSLAQTPRRHLAGRNYPDAG